MTFLGLTVPRARARAARAYFQEYLVGRQVYLKHERADDAGAVRAYVYLRNRLFVNRKMLAMGLARASREAHPHAARFKRAEGPASS